MDPDFYRNIKALGQTRIIMLVLDGLGGLAREPGGKTELETARTPNMDHLAARSALGLTIPVAPGVTPGSGPGHLALFGYDPIQNVIGRGAMEALGAGFELGPEDLAARGNFCTINPVGLLTDRRAGRIPSEKSLDLIKSLSTIRLEGIEIFIAPVKEHRFALIMRGPGLGEALADSDPQNTGVPALPVRPLNPDSEKSAFLANQFIVSAQKVLENQYPSNMILLRGFARLPKLATMQEKYGVNPAAIAVNGMYRGVACLVGMQVLELKGPSLNDEFMALEENWCHFDFFYLHVKKTDTFGEMGDFEGKVSAIEEVDALLPRIITLNPDVIIIAGDHSSPAILKSHSWHPVPLLVYSRFVRADGTAEFGERSCNKGSLGTIPATQVMPIALANAMRLAKYGA